MRSLKIIQVLAKIIWIICKVLFILFIIGAAGCLMGLTLFGLVQNVKVNADQTVAQLLAEKGVETALAYAGMSAGLISCGGGIFLAKYTELFFKEELDAGTPFKHDIVSKMRKVALVNILVSLGIAIVGAIVVGVVCALNHIDNKPDLVDAFSTVGFGLALLVISLFCEYGADLAEPKQEVDARPEEK